MKKYFLNSLVIVFILIPCRVFPQVVYEPLSSSVYGFLDRMDLAGYIAVHGEVKPFSRIDIAEKLKRLEENKNLLTSLEQDELEFYNKEFSIELGKINRVPPAEQLSFLHNDISGRFRLFTFADSTFTFIVDPILFYSANDIKGTLTGHLQNGAKSYGYISDNIGFSINYSDNTESGTYIDNTRSLHLFRELFIQVQQYPVFKISNTMRLMQAFQ